MSEENPNTTSASANAAEQKRCRVAVVDGFGAPRDVIRIEERACKVEPPAPDHVRVQVLAASINRGDLYVCLGEPYPIRFAGIKALGSDIAGRIVAVGANVPADELRVGDEVFGQMGGAFGGFADEVDVRAANVCRKPAALSFAAAATLGVAALTALQGLARHGACGPGARVLVTGASSGVGSVAVQLARALGAAHVAASARPAKFGVARRAGADALLAPGELARTAERYDVVLDCAAYEPVSAMVALLRPGGRYVHIGGSTSMRSIFATLVLKPYYYLFGGKTLVVFVQDITRKDLQTLADFCEQGKITPIIQQTFSLAQLPDAMEMMEQRKIEGKLVLDMTL